MAKLTITTFLTLDGVMQAPGGREEDTSGGFQNGGWLVPHIDQGFGEFMTDVFSRVDAFLLGRGTYRIFESYWPKMTDPNDPVASKLNNLPKHVVSRTLDKAEWKNSVVVRNLADEIAAIKARYTGELQVHGSHGLCQSLINGGYVDEINTLTFPVVVGSGKRLFETGTTPTAFKLARSRTTENGIVLATYQRTGAPTYGTFEAP